MSSKTSFKKKSIPPDLVEELESLSVDTERMLVAEDDEYIHIYIDNIYAGYAEKPVNGQCWILDTISQSEDVFLDTVVEVLHRCFTDFENLGVVQRVLNSILETCDKITLNGLLLDWLDKGFVSCSEYYSLFENSSENYRDLLRALLNEWGKNYFSK